MFVCLKSINIEGNACRSASEDCASSGLSQDPSNKKKNY